MTFDIVDGNVLMHMYMSRWLLSCCYNIGYDSTVSAMLVSTHISLGLLGGISYLVWERFV